MTPSPHLLFFLFFFSGKVDLRREIRRHLTVSANWNKHDEVLKVREFILKVTFSLASPSSMLKLLLTVGNAL